MGVKFQQVITTADWVKIGVLLLIAVIAWWQVFALYSQPFELGEEIERQRLIQAHDEQTQPPFLPAVP